MTLLNSTALRRTCQPPCRPPHPLDTEHQRARELADEVCRAFAARRFAEANRLRSALRARGVDVRVIEPGEGVTA